MRLEDSIKVFITDLADAASAPATPNTVRGLIDLFADIHGGERAGRAALARQIAQEQLAAGKEYRQGEQGAYKAAQRNVARYVTPGAEKRTPQELQKALDKIADRTATQQSTERILDKARREGGVTTRFAGDVHISNDEKSKSFTVTLSADELEPFIEEAQAHHWRAAADELNYALLNAYGGGIADYGGVITDVDELTPTYGG